MAVFRIEKTRDYTVMSNHHLKDRTLTLKSKGLLSMMLSLPDEWNYTTRGLAAICREGVDSIGAALKELENHGYIRRTQLRDEKGKITDTEYVIYEMPQCEPPSSPGTPLPGTAKPYTENPDMGVPDTAEPCTENPAQLNTNQTKTDLSSTEISNPIQSNPPTPTGARMGTDRMGARECYREVILDNIEYSYLVQDSHIDREQLDEIVDLIVDTVCSARKVIRIAGDDYPAEVVKSRFMKLDSSHVQYVKLAQAFRLAPGADLSGKLLSIGNGFTAALSSPWLSFHPTDLLIGIAGAVILRMAVYLKGKNAKKYRHGIEYGSARCGA